MDDRQPHPDHLTNHPRHGGDPPPIGYARVPPPTQPHADPDIDPAPDLTAGGATPPAVPADSGGQRPVGNQQWPADSAPPRPAEPARPVPPPDDDPATRYGEPIRPWAIGDPGRSFVEVRALLGDPLEAADTILDGGHIAGLEVRAASVRGLSHRQQGTARQDAYGLATSADERWLVVVVADGVSAGRFSHRAARMVVRQGALEVARRLTDGGRELRPADWYDVYQRLSQRILHNGERELGCEPPQVPKLMATTATFLVCQTRPVNGGRVVQTAWLGDSPVWSRYPSGRWHCLSAIKGAGREVASSAVAALPHLPPHPDGLGTAIYDIPEQAALFVMTDGVGDPLDNAQGVVGRALADAWRHPPAPLDFANQVGFGRKGWDDDRTAVGVWPAEGGSPT